MPKKPATAQPGDILLYRRVRSIPDALVDIGAILEDGLQTTIYYHVAIALGPSEQIETDGHTVATHAILYDGSFNVFRPPIDEANRRTGLACVRGFIGQHYDWTLITDDALRDLSRGVLHLPLWYVQSKERKEKVCSSLTVRYFRHAQWAPPRKLDINSSPEDIALAVHEWPVKG